MSIVGPRPERPVLRRAVQAPHPAVHAAAQGQGGITGWAQVNGWRGNTSLEKRIEYDLYYIENWSVALDLKIMWLTLGPRIAESTLTDGFTPLHASSRHHRRCRIHRISSFGSAARPRLFRGRIDQPA
jgi:hypothetical protein